MTPLQVVELLLSDSRVDPTVEDNVAIRIASRRGHAEVVRSLLEDPRVDRYSRNDEAMRGARQNGYEAVVRQLLQTRSCKRKRAFSSYDSSSSSAPPAKYYLAYQ
jgi:hypothetical protein